MKAGATVVTGGKRGPGEGGYYYEPTVITGCRQDMEIIRREVFGPVVPIVTFNDLDEAIAYANDSDYGLTSSVYTQNLDVALKVSQEIRFGETYINRENFEAMQGFTPDGARAASEEPTASTASTSSCKLIWFTCSPTD